jgi:hypothetical protein
MTMLFGMQILKSTLLPCMRVSAAKAQKNDNGAAAPTKLIANC